MTDKQIIIYKKECYNEPHCSLNQVLEQLNAYKMEADEGKEINAELKAENAELKKQHQADKGLITSTGKQNYQLLQEYDKLKTALTEIKDIAENAKTKVFVDMEEFWEQILQKISEVKNG